MNKYDEALKKMGLQTFDEVNNGGHQKAIKAIRTKIIQMNDKTLVDFATKQMK